jgi:tRNA (cmo5U34)-methyltransferase
MTAHRRGAGLSTTHRRLGCALRCGGEPIGGRWLAFQSVAAQTGWENAQFAAGYLARQDDVAHRTEGEAALVESLPPALGTVLDLGTGDGRLLRLVLSARPDAQGVGLDVSPTMVATARERFEGDRRARIVAHDLNAPLAEELGTFDAIVSCLAIHHCTDERKRTLYAECWARLAPDGVLLNLDYVTSPTPRLHEEFLAALRASRTGAARPSSDRTNAPVDLPLDVGTQLRWLRELGFADVDCLWKWREFALLAGRKPA